MFALEERVLHICAVGIPNIPVIFEFVTVNAVQSIVEDMG